MDLLIISAGVIESADVIKLAYLAKIVKIEIFFLKFIKIALIILILI